MQQEKCRNYSNGINPVESVKIKFNDAEKGDCNFN